MANNHLARLATIYTLHNTYNGLGKFGSAAYMLYDCRYFMDVSQANFALNPDRVEPAKEGLKIYYDDFEKTLGNEF